MRTVSDSDTSMVHISSPVSDLKKCHLDGSRFFNLHNLSNAIKTISKHSTTCGAVVELIGEVRSTEWAGLKNASPLLQM